LPAEEEEATQQPTQAGQDILAAPADLMDLTGMPLIVTAIPLQSLKARVAHNSQEAPAEHLAAPPAEQDLHSLVELEELTEILTIPAHQVAPDTSAEAEVPGETVRQEQPAEAQTMPNHL